MRLSLERGMDLVAFEEEYDADEYRLVLGSRQIVVWKGAGENAWNEATTRTVGLLNALLSAHGSPERAWSLYGGNDGFIVFASEDQVALLNSALPERERLTATGS